jgi:hypothetical protein
MGSWGTGLSSNDTYADIYDHFFELYNEGRDVEEISKALIIENEEILKIPEDHNNFWFAVAKAQWECKQLDPKILEKVKETIESGADIEIWHELGASERDLRRRSDVLESFLAKLQTEKSKPKPRKKKIIRQPVFEKGSCITFNLAGGNYGGAVILEAIHDTELGLNLVAVTRINQGFKPVVRDFENAEILIKSFAKWQDEEEVVWMFPFHFEDDRQFFEIIGNINVHKKFSEKETKFAFTGDWKYTLIDVTNLQFEWEKENATPKKRIFIKELITKRKFRLW